MCKMYDRWYILSYVEVIIKYSLIIHNKQLTRALILILYFFNCWPLLKLYRFIMLCMVCLLCLLVFIVYCYPHPSYHSSIAFNAYVKFFQICTRVCRNLFFSLCLHVTIHERVDTWHLWIVFDGFFSIAQSVCIVFFNSKCCYLS